MFIYKNGVIWVSTGGLSSNVTVNAKKNSFAKTGRGLQFWTPWIFEVLLERKVAPKYDFGSYNSSLSWSIAAITKFYLLMVQSDKRDHQCWPSYGLVCE